MHTNCELVLISLSKFDIIQRLDTVKLQTLLTEKVIILGLSILSVTVVEFGTHIPGYWSQSIMECLLSAERFVLFQLFFI